MIKYSADIQILSIVILMKKKDVRLSKNEFVEELIKSGVSAKGTEYEQQYHDYWNPIMEQHQKKVDEMK